MPDRVPVSTYRLQLTADFRFADAAAAAGYLAGLGVTHAYLSPILQAAPGSTHGYDVVDHSRISADLGGEDGFRAMVAEFRAAGLGVIVDIVPNHMAIPVPESLNQQLWSVLAEGCRSRFASWFDVDWEAGGGRLLLPVLGSPLADCLPDLRMDDATDGPVLRYFGHVFPLRAGTAGLPLPELVEAQHYRLAHWRAAATDLNWRRFFDITSLIAVRVEDPGVFRATHRLLLDLTAQGLIDGLRVDHPDGLSDPRGYLRRLAEATGGAWVVTEKILTGAEQLPPDWPCAGTTGYDALGIVGGLFVDPAGAPALTQAYQNFTGEKRGFAEVAYEAKRQIATGPLAAEVSRLTRLAAAAGGRAEGGSPEPVRAEGGSPEQGGALAGITAGDLRAVLVELLAGFGVYRAYVVPGEPPVEAAVATVDAAAAFARGHLPPHLHPVLGTVRDLVLGLGPNAPGEAGMALIVAFGQTCGPVMAKGVEDTAFYRWSRLAALNEVGGEPGTFGASPEEFHAFAIRLAETWPATMTTLSTHDTKRQEDVRARLAVLPEIPREWASEVTRWRERAAELASGRAGRADGATPERECCLEPDTEYLLWQTLVGAWPVGPGRITGYLLKAAREAKTATSWTDPDPRYEEATAAFADLVLTDATLTGWISGFVDGLASAARSNSLSAKLVQLTMPGVADTYQGCELAGFALVDPDNRRPADFARRRRLLASLDAGRGGSPPPDGLDFEKLLVTSAALRLRRDHPDWFAGAYEPVPADGPAARHAVAFARGGRAVTVVTRLPAGLAAAGGWAGTVLPLPDPAPGGPSWRDVLTGAIHAGPAPALADLLARYPVALLVPEGET